MAAPNVIFILIDDMGWKDLACYGSDFYETPNIDRLAQEGMTFTDAYAACPVCSPTRASIQTGKYPARLGLTNWIPGEAKGKLLEAPYIKHLPLDEYTIARALDAAGYNTWHVGKWHLGEEPYWPQQHGYKENIGGCDWGQPKEGYFSPWNIPGMTNAPEGTYLTDHLSEQACGLIRDNDDAPFFLHMSYYTVHCPIQAKLQHIERFEQKVRDMGLDEVKTFEEGEHFPCEHKKDKRVIRRLVQSNPVYASMIWSLDEGVGRILDTLEETGELDNTIIFFFSDNGGLATSEGSPTCNAPLAEGKGWMYEGGTREPLIVTWPGITDPGSQCSVPTTSTDFYPTILEMTGLEPMPHQHCDGESLVGLLGGENELERDAIFWHYPHYGNQGGTPGCSVRAGDYKLIEFFEDGRLELYNLREDLSEGNDLSQDMPQKTQELHERLREWRDEVEANMPRENPDWEPLEG
ncbi:MAG: sulfatase [Armatimonadota bacterium]